MLKPREQCNKFIEDAHNLGFTDAISEGKLRNIIMNSRNVVNEKTVNSWLNALVAFGLIEEQAPHVYKIKNGAT